MNCEEVQALLEEDSGREAVAAHLSGCATCATHAALLAQLRLLAPGDTSPPKQWASRLPHPPWLWRKPATYVPLILGLGCLLVGGLAFQAAKGLPAQEQLELLGRVLWETTGLALGEALRSVGEVLGALWGMGAGVAALAVGSLGVLLLRWAGVRARA